jgi:hypothetical protein
MRDELPIPTTLQLRPPPLRIAPHFEGFTTIGPGEMVPGGVLHGSVVFDEAWELQLDVVEEDNQLKIKRICFDAYEGQPSLGSAAVLAALKIRSVEEWAEELVGQQVWRETAPEHFEPLPPPKGRDYLVGRRRRTRIDDKLLAEVASVYRQAVESGYSAPTKAVGEHFNVSRPQAARYVAQAREAKKLGKASPGKKGER